MQLKLTRSETFLTATCLGRFTFDDYQRFKELLDELNDNPPNKLVVDMAGVEFVDSAAMGMLLVANDQCRKINAEIVLNGTQGQVKRMVRNAKFGGLMTVA